jgi:hypothetical protein
VKLVLREQKGPKGLPGLPGHKVKPVRWGRKGLLVKQGLKDLPVNPVPVDRKGHKAKRARWGHKGLLVKLVPPGRKAPRAHVDRLVR